MPTSGPWRCVTSKGGRIQGGAAPPRAEGKSLPAREGQTLLLSLKAQPPLPPGGVAPTTKRQKEEAFRQAQGQGQDEKGAEVDGGSKKSPSPERRKRRSKTPESQEELV